MEYEKKFRSGVTVGQAFCKQPEPTEVTQEPTEPTIVTQKPSEPTVVTQEPTQSTVVTQEQGTDLVPPQFIRGGSF